MEQDFTALYRHFDAEKRLLYVGISLSASRRLSQHMRDSKWARAITSIEIEHFETRSQAVEAERRAILAEKPLWNVLHNLAEAVQSGTTSVGSTRKLRPEEVMFDYGNVARSILATGAKVEQILELITETRIEGFLETDRFISLYLKMREGLVAEDVGLEELFNVRAPRPTPSSAFLMVTGVSAFEPGHIVDQANI
jgi:predicted GIY-YIG superfamily endonuclease